MRIGTSPEYGKIAGMVTLVTGVVLGSVLCALFPGWGIWQSGIFRQGMGTLYYLSSFEALFLQLMGLSGIWLAFLAFSGTSLLGIPAAAGILLMRGMALGAVLQEVYRMQGAVGFLTSLIFVVPYALGVTLIFSLGARETVRTSRWIWELARGRFPEEEASLKMFGLRYLAAAGLLAVMNLLQSAWLMWGYPVFLGKMTQ